MAIHPSVVKYLRFTDSSGRWFTDEELNIQLQKAIEKEDYEDAEMIRKELQRRRTQRTKNKS